MKQFFILFISGIIMLSTACVNETGNAVEGVWDLVYAERIAGDTLVWKFPGDYTGTDIKVWTKTHVIFVGRFKTDTTFVDNYGGGTYTLNGNRYEETILYHGATDLVGNTLKMLIEVRSDSIIQSWPVDDNWQVDKSNYQLEKYVRLE
ncbi:hypothetical protein JXQ31_17450 [candidate division KSB1 bacterium]|nr:hypothetical protein [candidate division KSB1 bacterium]